MRKSVLIEQIQVDNRSSNTNQQNLYEDHEINQPTSVEEIEMKQPTSSSSAQETNNPQSSSSGVAENDYILQPTVSSRL